MKTIHANDLDAIDGLNINEINELSNGIGSASGHPFIERRRCGCHPMMPGKTVNKVIHKASRILRLKSF
ncbi:MAG: hypothetical protein CVU72_05765 [Deltaproteobacteria bacterium HGW-Deltaproteobacteria-7]|jgi:hypothetical protein|nr:MAG: hypothetical protein CVU72_05765 [Deltaproteobacteria bacterium HGW-Deltaproteobacteria-7]PKN20242.1 MAG: hypothetical protein CVU71_00130 [Deltaproteobacteria bacterium HGW-Deltaproteobacteria-6]